MKVLMISDKPNWSYATIIKNITRSNKDTDLTISYASYKEDNVKKKIKSYDFFFVLGWQICNLLPFLDKKRTLTGIHSHQGWDNRKTTPDKDVDPPARLIKYLSGFLGVNVVSRRLENIFKKKGLNVFYTPNGVNSEEFFPGKSKQNAGSAGSLKNEWNKGIFDVIKPVCQKTGVKFVSACREKNYIPHSSMPGFYKNLKYYICFSLSEGMPITVLEAASAGCIIISTRCGDIPFLIKNGENGYLINRDPKELSSILEFCEKNNANCEDISKRIRKEIKEKWDWSVNAKKWIEFIKRNTNGI
ncbi:MAG: glycosyltransferase [Candidatus Woesearchaeota archaeon]|jgi:glycosyltransferase involved in cell wall biosynthesis